MGKKPTGALAYEEFMEYDGPTYAVYSRPSTTFGFWERGDFRIQQLSKHATYPECPWFGGIQFGYVFTNYFHALAYSLKVKNGTENETVHTG